MRTIVAVGCLLSGLFAFALAPVLADEPATAPAKASIPDAAALKDAQKLVDEVYADDIAKAKNSQEKAELAKKLLKAATDTKNDAAGKYVLLGMAKDTAASAGDADTAFTAITELEQYQIDSLTVKLETLTTISKSVRGQDAKALVDRINTLTDEALATDRYDVAGQLAQLYLSLAKTTKELDAIKAATGRVQEVRNAEVAYGQVKKALATLADTPKDSEANFAVGRFYCLMKGQWEKGLPMLALGSDATLKALAEKELAKPTDAGKQVELGDGWWALAEKETGAAQGRMRERAGYWYEQALPTLTGLVKAKVEKRLKEVPKGHATEEELSRLLNNVSEWTVYNGTWKQNKDGTIIGSGDSLLQFKHELPTDYTLEFTWRQKEGIRPRILFPDIKKPFPPGVSVLSAALDVVVLSDYGKPYGWNDKMLFVYNAENIVGKAVSYTHNAEYKVRVVFFGKNALFYMNDTLVANFTRPASVGTRLAVSSGDSGSLGTMVLSQFRLSKVNGKTTFATDAMLLVGRWDLNFGTRSEHWIFYADGTVTHADNAWNQTDKNKGSWRIEKDKVLVTWKPGHAGDVFYLPIKPSLTNGDCWTGEKIKARKTD